MLDGPVSPGSAEAGDWPEDTSAPRSEPARDLERLEQQVRSLTFLYRLERELSDASEIREIASRTVVLARRVLGVASGGFVLVGSGSRVRLVVPSSKRRPGEPQAQSVRGILAQVLSSWVSGRWRGLLLPDMRADSEWERWAGDTSGFRSLVAVPLRHEGDIRGVLALVHGAPGFFGPHHLDLLRTAAPRIAAALVLAGRRRAAAQDQARLETVVVNLTEPLFALDADGVVVLTNPPLERLVGRPAHDLLGRIYRDVISLEHRSQDFPIEHVLRGRYASFDMDMLLHNADGETIPVRVGCGAITEGGKPSGAVVVLRDIRYLKEIEGLREDLTNMLVHDLKGPLASIGSTVQLLQHYPLAKVGEETLQELLSIADKSVRRLSRMIEAVLDVQRLEAGQFPLSLGPTSLQEIVAQVMAEASPLAAAAEIETHMEVDSDLPPVNGDAGVLQRVLWNLLDNALKYTPRAGSISVAARQFVVPDQAGCAGVPQDLAPGRWVRVDVVDSGLGIPDEERERIFGKFAQGRRSPVRRRGVGLGLAFCRLAVEAHGGRIWVESIEGQGSVFTFALPVVSPSEAGDGRHPEASPAG